MRSSQSTLPSLNRQTVRVNSYFPYAPFYASVLVLGKIDPPNNTELIVVRMLG